MSCIENKTKSITIKEYPSPVNTNLWLNYTKESTVFKIWSPTADNLQLHLYKMGNDGAPLKTILMNSVENGVWEIKLNGDLNGTYYTYQVQINGQRLKETPGIYAQAVGVNGKRGMVLDLETTNPSDWETDKGPQINYPNEAIIYEMHIRNMTIHPKSGSHYPGKYIGLVEHGTKEPSGLSTGIDHIKDMGFTHVHLLPTFDYQSVDESNLKFPQFNWGYDPQNYNVPEGSYSTNPFKAEIRIKEFKKMVQSFHNNGIGVIMDVVYNHTALTENSNFNLEFPEYYYRYNLDGTPSNASECGNETASEKDMMRKYMIESVLYWAKEYHIDGFRFDLMGIHDIETMNEITNAVKDLNPNIIIYGEGWTAGDSLLPIEKSALKQNMREMPKLAVFSDEIRDGIKGSVFDFESPGFVSGAKNMEESVKMGIVGCIEHSQINFEDVHYSKKPWAIEPWQSVIYTSCHDNNTLYDKLKISRIDASESDIIKMDKLANAIVLTSQGIPFIHGGAEMLRTKLNEHNSYNLPDSINQMDWSLKAKNKNVVDYYKNLIALRKEHPAFKMTSSQDVRNNLKFEKTEKGLISYQISNNANGDTWKNILVVYNANEIKVSYKMQGTWNLAVSGNEFFFDNNSVVINSVDIPPISMAILFQY